MAANAGVSKPTLAAAIIVRELKRRNGKGHHELKAALQKHKLGAGYLPRGVRKIRDLYGENALVTERPGGRGVIVYVLDPELSQGVAYAFEQTKRGLTEARHIMSILDWLAGQYGNRGAVRRARRYEANAIAELEELYETLR